MALASLQASAPPMDFALLRAVAEEELGRPLERAFARFDDKPLASASIGQVHRATLPSGEEVAVKIQYPGVADAIRADLGNAALLYRLISPMYPGVDTRSVVDELRGRIIEELDYAREADNQRTFASLYEGHPFIRIPRVHASHSTARVLTTEFVDGRRFADVCADDEATRVALRRDPVPLRVRLDRAARHVQRRSAPRQLPVRRRGARRLPRLRLREVLPRRDAARLARARQSAPVGRSRRLRAPAGRAHLHPVGGRASISTCSSTTSATSTSRSRKTASSSSRASTTPAASSRCSSPTATPPGCRSSSTCRATSCS